MRNNHKLKKVIVEMIALAKRVYPRVEYTTYAGGYSGVDATIEFFSPPKYEEKLDKVLRKKAHDALIKENIFIAPLTLSKKYKSTHTAR